MSVLAAIVRDLDFETCHPDTKSSTTSDEAAESLAALYDEFSGSLALFSKLLLLSKLIINYSSL